MNSERILTRKTLGLDHRVWRVMIVLFVLSIGLYSYTLIDKPTCTPVDFKVKTIDNDSVYSTDEILSFSSLRFEKNITWDFGDNSPIGTGTFITHRFAAEGKYFIKVTVNSDCQFIKPITVRKAVAVNLISDKEQIDGHPSTFVGAGESYTSLLSAKTYEWSVENHPEYGLLNGQSVTYRFLSPGEFTIQLTLDKDRLKIYRKSVTVVENEKPKPVEKIDKLIDYDKLAKLDNNPAKEKMGISELTFAEYLEKVISGKSFAKDFDDYLCSEGKTPTIINGQSNKQVTFEQACAELNGKHRSKFLGMGKKAVHIKSVRLNKNKDNCITLIEIKY